jgi:ankyrin repeat protein
MSGLTADEAAAAAAAEAGWGSLLLSHDMQLDAPTVGGWTALYLAAQEGLLADAAWLLRNGAGADAPAADGATPLHVACQAQQPAIVRMLAQFSLLPPPSAPLPLSPASLPNSKYGEDLALSRPCCPTPSF